MPRKKVAIYARFSSDLQKKTSIEDQARLCEEFARGRDWEVVGFYSDFAMSGATLNRPGMQTLLKDAEAGKFEIIIAEALDRFSRDQGDTAHFHKRMNFHGVRVVTISEGDVDIMAVGLKGMMNELYLVELKKKVLRGQRGRVEAGKITAGLAYGYEVVRKFDETGKPVAGDRNIVPEKARIVRRIFDEYAGGKSPRAIAEGLSQDKIPTPTGKRFWNPSTISGNNKRGIGILNCDLYRGVIRWNRTTELKEPGTGRRITRYNPESEQVVSKVEKLRIISDELWDAVKARQAKHAQPRKDFRKSKRPKYLLSGMIRCGTCGKTYAMRNHSRYGCTNQRFGKGCSNKQTIKRDDLEELVLGALKSDLLDERYLKIFCDEYTKHINTLRIESNASIAGYKAEIAKLERERKRCVKAITDGIPGIEVKDQMIGIMERRQELEGLLETTKAEPILLHPKMADHYRKQVGLIARALNDEKLKHEAQDALRGLIERIELSPNAENTGLVVDLHGDLAGILSYSAQRIDNKRKSGNFSIDGNVIRQLVGPEGLEPPTNPL